MGVLIAVGLLPGRLKNVMLRRLFGHRIGRRVKIGLAYFDCAELVIDDDASIGHGAVFTNCGSVHVGRHAVVGPMNLFRGGDRIDLSDYTQLLRFNVINAIPHHDCYGVLDSTFSLGYGAVVSAGHWIDFTDRVTIGRRSMLAGRTSSIWTHNRRRAAPVRIGDFCCVGSETRIAPGVTIPDYSIVGLGSVVSSSFTAPCTFIGGAPARVTRNLTESDADTLFDKTRWDLPDEPIPKVLGGRPRSAPADITQMEEDLRAHFDDGTIEAKVRQIVADVARIRPADVDLGRSLIDQGVDSLQLIVLRESLESAFRVQYSDETWLAMETPALIVSHVEARSRSTQGSTVAPSSKPTGLKRGLISAGLSCHDIEIGMPLMGRNNLGETPLLRHLGDQRWRHISDAMGVSSRHIVDDEGERLYATFFYVEIAFPPEKPMATFGENDRFTVISTLSRYGTSMLDGTSYLLPANGHASHDEVPFASLQHALAAGVPAVRLSNIFVRQFAGAEWLKKGRPVHPGFARIPAESGPPDSYASVKQAEKEGRFGHAASGWIPMTDGPVRREHRLVPDRDLNGVGLVYFANYPLFLDICERDVLLSANLPLPDSLVDQRTLVHRRSAYLNNASARDTLIIEIEPWMETPILSEDRSAARCRMRIDYRMYRQSDLRLMMVSTAEKVIVRAPVEDLAFLSQVSVAANRKD